MKGRRRCRACGAATTDPWPDDEELERAYGDWYRPSSGARFSLAGDVLLTRTRGLLAARIDEIAPPGPILDVGAGDGTLLDALHRRDREATGLERGGHRADLRDDPLDEIEGDAAWAGIVLWHALEHLPEPGEAIRQAARLLQPGGVIAIAVPNNASLQARAFGDEWLHLDIPRHLIHLSTTSLIGGIERSGFEIERISNVRGGQIVVGWLDGLVGWLPGGLDLYQALRRPEAQSDRLSPGRRLASIAAGVALLPVAAACAIAEVAMRRGGTIYVEGRRV
jgi:SAM-dependent methyltransferase